MAKVKTTDENGWAIDYQLSAEERIAHQKYMEYMRQQPDGQGFTVKTHKEAWGLFKEPLYGKEPELS